MTSDTAIAPEILTDDQIEDLQLELELARPARVKIPATGALADHDDKMRAGARNFL